MDLLNNLGRNAPATDYSCDSIGEFRVHLRQLLADKVSDEKAEHISATLVLRPNINFDVHVPDGSSDGPNNNVDSGAGGAAGPSQVSPVAGGSTLQIRANDAIANQPPSNPVAQQAVARYLVGEVSLVDSCNWIVREVRDSHGWTFTYLCKDSMQNWSRQISKVPPKTLIGEWSNKDGQDPINMARPAFDCRGLMTITFSKSSRTINVKYEHTCLHKTVAQLSEILVPPPQPNTLPASQEKLPKTPRKRRVEGVDANGETSTQPKKRRKKKDDAPDGEASGQVAGADSQGVAAPTVSHGGLNISAEEAERRRKVAIDLLIGGGIPPESLSEDQMEIFQNQAPELQQQSLEMLQKYGAERLRIVHPDKPGDVNQPTTSEGGQNSGDSAAAASTTAKPKRQRKKSDGVGQNPVDGTATAPGPRKQRESRGACVTCKVTNEKCDRARPTCAQCLETGAQCFYPAPKPRKSRKSSPPPADLEQQAEQQAEPEPQQVAEPEPEEVVDEEPGDLGSPGFHDPNYQDAVTVHPQPEVVTEPESIALSHLVSPALDSLPSYSPGIYHHPAGLSFPQPAAAEPPPIPQASMSEYNSVVDHSASNENYMYSTADTVAATSSALPQSSTELTFPEQPVASASSVQQKQQVSPRQARAAARSRRNTPSAPVAAQTSLPESVGTSVASNGHSTTSWQNSPTISNSNIGAAPMASVSTRSSTLNQTTGAPLASPVYPPQQQAYHTGDRQQPSAALQSSVSTTVQQVQQQPSPTMRNSPYQAATQAASRAKSRQGHRAQTRTPVQDTSATSRPPQVPSSRPTGSSSVHSTSSASSTTVTANSGPGYDMYSQYSTSRAEQAPNQIAYKPYANQQPAPTPSNRYSTNNYNYSTQPNNPAPSSSTMSSNPVTQSMSNSYTSTASNTAQQWGSGNMSHTRTSHSYSSTQPASTSSSRNPPSASSTSQSQTLQNFNVRPQPPAPQTRSSPSTSGQQSQQPSYSSYSSYSSQQPQQGQSSHQQQQQNNWYGNGFTAANTTATAYNTRSTSGVGGYSSSGNGTGSHAHGSSGYGSGGHHQSHQQQQHHRAMGLSDHNYGGMDQDQALYDLLRNGSGN